MEPFVYGRKENVRIRNSVDIRIRYALVSLSGFGNKTLYPCSS